MSKSNDTLLARLVRESYYDRMSFTSLANPHPPPLPPYRPALSSDVHPRVGDSRGGGGAGGVLLALQILAEIGAEKLTRDYSAAFIGESKQRVS